MQAGEVAALLCQPSRRIEIGEPHVHSSHAVNPGWWKGFPPHRDQRQKKSRNLTKKVSKVASSCVWVTFSFVFELLWCYFWFDFTPPAWAPLCRSRCFPAFRKMSPNWCVTNPIWLVTPYECHPPPSHHRSTWLVWLNLWLRCVFQNIMDLSFQNRCHDVTNQGSHGALEASASNWPNLPDAARMMSKRITSGSDVCDWWNPAIVAMTFITQKRTTQQKSVLNANSHFNSFFTGIFVLAFEK